MKELTISQIVKKSGLLFEALKDGPVRIVWKEQKPNGKVIFSAIANKEGLENE